MNVLEEIVNRKKFDLKKVKELISVDQFLKQINSNQKGEFFKTLTNNDNQYHIIPETKKSSPSAGIIVKEYDPVKKALTYKDEGFEVISVLTEEHYFNGSVEHIKSIKSKLDLKILRKDFIIDEWQIYESKAYGADCILLIAESLSKKDISHFSNIANELNLDVLLEFHNEEQIDKVLSSGFDLIGINNRNLKNIETNISHCENLLNTHHQILKPQNIIAESGFTDKSQLDNYVNIGVNKFLIGEGLLRNTLL
tara:strand:+ start:243 stop:1001 length:759 start_codon:yes stop_codon:yes gene_type:complete